MRLHLHAIDENLQQMYADNRKKVIELQKQMKLESKKVDPKEKKKALERHTPPPINIDDIISGKAKEDPYHPG